MIRSVFPSDVADVLISQPNSLIRLKHAGYAKALGQLLQNTSSRTLTNFLGFELLLRLQKLVKRKTNAPLECLLLHEKPQFALALETLYFRERFSQEKLTAVEELVLDVRESLVELLEQNFTWLNPLTKTSLVKQYGATKFLLSSRERRNAFDIANIEEFYREVSQIETTSMSLTAKYYARTNVDGNTTQLCTVAS